MSYQILKKQKAEKENCTNSSIWTLGKAKIKLQRSDKGGGRIWLQRDWRGYLGVNGNVCTVAARENKHLWAHVKTHQTERSRLHLITATFQQSLFEKCVPEAGEVAWWGNHMLCKCEDWSSDPQLPHKWWIGNWPTCNSSMGGWDRDPQTKPAGQTICIGKLWAHRRHSASTLRLESY